VPNVKIKIKTGTSALKGRHKIAQGNALWRKNSKRKPFAGKVLPNDFQISDGIEFSKIRKNEIRKRTLCRFFTDNEILKR
jgi:hypothetical protein